jgi:hypothetical protein
MGSKREKDKKLKRQRRRRRKIRKLRAKFVEAKNLEDRQRLIEKIKRISIYPSKVDLPQR